MAATNYKQKSSAETAADAMEALGFISPDIPRDEWVTVAMSLKNGLGDEGFQAFDDWSQGGDSYNAADTRSTWKSISIGGGITISSLFAKAKEHGYKPTGKPTQKQAEKKATKAPALEKEPRPNDEALASVRAEWAAAKPVTDHPYLSRKSVKSHGLRVDRYGNLLVPAYRNGELGSFQRIPAEAGAKKPNAAGVPMKGCSFTLGNAEGANRIYVGEGYATAATVHETTGMPAVVTFGCEAMMGVGVELRKKHPYAEIVFLVDDDVNSKENIGLTKCTAAATVVDGLVAVPDFGDERSEKDSDFNDLHKLFGRSAVQMSLAEAFDPDAELLPVYKYHPERMLAVEYVIDGFISTGVTLIAGSPGVGKTTAMVTMAAVAAGLVKKANGITATLRRKVYYVTEDPRQVERILYGLKKHGMIECSDEEILDWFTIVNARRRSPEEVGKMVAKARRRGTRIAPAAQNHFPCEPLIVLDTSNATIDMDDENNNSEAGKAISAVKQALGDGALWIAGHTAKNIKHAEVSNLSFRGAGAFEGDCHAVSFIFQEKEVDKNTRFWALGKHRYEAEFREVRIESSADYELVETDWGQKQKCWYRISELSKSSELDREQAKADAKADKQCQEVQRFKGEILALLLAAQKTGETYNRSDVIKAIAGTEATKRDAINELVKNRDVVETRGEKNAKYLTLRDPAKTL